MINYTGRFERVQKRAAVLGQGPETNSKPRRWDVIPALRARLHRERKDHLKSAIIETGGKQYRVAEGDVIFVEKLKAEESIVFDKVLAVIDGEETKFGAPLVDGATVTGAVLKHGKAKKIRIFKMKKRKGYRRRQGHRQPYTQVRIETITA